MPVSSVFDNDDEAAAQDRAKKESNERKKA